MAIFGLTDQCLNDRAAAQGFGVTWLSRSYETYDRELFEDTLNDWQWTGEGEPPAWYTGEPWSGVEDRTTASLPWALSATAVRTTISIVAVSHEPFRSRKCPEREKWRRRESNPRPRSPRSERLQA